MCATHGEIQYNTTKYVIPMYKNEQMNNAEFEKKEAIHKNFTYLMASAASLDIAAISGCISGMASLMSELRNRQTFEISLCLKSAVACCLRCHTRPLLCSSEWCVCVSWTT